MSFSWTTHTPAPAKGYKGPSTDIPFEDVWAVMVDKVYHPEKFLPVVDVSTKEEGGYVRRLMTMAGIVLDEKIYILKDKKLIQFDHSERDESIVNAWVEDEKLIEYWREIKSTGERISFPIHPIVAIEKTYELAKAKAE